MNADKFYITSWVVIRGKMAVANGAHFFGKPETDEVSFVKALYRELKSDYPKFFKMDNLCKLAFAGAELLLKDRAPGYEPDEVALVLSNASSSLDTDKTYFNAVEDKSNYFPSPAVFVYTLPNIMMGEICIRHRFQGENAFFITEKFDAGLLAGYTGNLLSSGKAKCAITGWAEVNDSGWEAAFFLVEPSEKENEKKALRKESLDEIYTLKR